MKPDPVPAPSPSGRTAMYYPHGQDHAYTAGAYDYLDSIAMVGRMATIGAYVQRLGLRSVLDLGCGTGELLSCLPDHVAYTGIDLAESAVETARHRFRNRPHTQFHSVDFRDWDGPEVPFDGVVWAGIGCAWTLRGRGGDFADWLGILGHAERMLTPNGALILELVTPHWPALERLIDGRYTYVSGCDLDCFQSEESPRRSIRVFRRKPVDPLPITLSQPGSSLIPGHLARRLIDLAAGMGQGSDAARSNLGYGYLYYGLVRLYRPQKVVCIGSYRGFSAVCLALGCKDNGLGTCTFLDPGRVDGHWHDPANIEHLRREFGLGERLQHLGVTSQEAVERGLLPESIDLLLIDGDHSYEGVKFDFEHIGARVPSGGLILLHDAVLEGRGFTAWQVKDFLASEVYSRPEYEVLTLPIAAGLSLVRKRIRS